jgi:single-stranded-DNA-specific exonuclease
MARWIEPESVAVPPSLRDAVGGHPLVAQTLARRGIVMPGDARAFLDPAAYTPASPADLPDLSLAVERLRRAIDEGQQIAVWGDFDADGQTATALLLESLRTLNADVRFHIPARHEGHGFHSQGLKRLIAGGVRLIVTCDTGVTAHTAVVHANALGADVIITDHHVPGEHLPPALAVINPHRLATGHPLATLAGVGVAYQLARALDPAVADRALDLVALGLVADVATLTGDARYLVQRGLHALQHTDRLGLQAVFEAAELRPEGITEEHIGFVLGPRLNALGRLADARQGVELLTTDDRTRARTLATEVEGLNARRQWLTKQVTDAALVQVERDPALLNDYHALVLSHPSWPGGVTGIVAGRLAERFRKPAVLISAPPGEIARGSGRSVPGVDLVAALTDCASAATETPLLQSFGGHPGAAGFSVDPERIPELRAALSRAIAGRVETIPESVLVIDSYVDLPDLTFDLVSDTGRLSPFGRGNPPLALVVRDLHLLSETIIGRTGEHRRLTVEDAHDRSQTVFWWQGAGWPLPQGRFDLALSLRTSDYRGIADVQVEWIEAREREPEAIEVSTAPTVRVRDYRSVSNPEAVLEGLIAESEILVWAEGETTLDIETHDRRQLVPARRLAVWTLPPGRRELQAALERVKPDEVTFFAHDPGLDQPGAFLQRLAGSVKFALRALGGWIDLEAVAATTAQRIGTVRVGLDWLAAQEQIAIVEQDTERWRISTAVARSDLQAVDAARTHLEALLTETAAYRAYLRDAPAETLSRLANP